MPSIRQNSHPETLPDFRNLGVTARALIGVHLLAIAAVLAGEPDWVKALNRFVQATSLIEPPLLASLALLYVGARWLMRVPYWAGCALVIALVLAIAGLTHAVVGEAVPGSLPRVLVLAALAAAAVLAYLRLHTK